MICIRPFVFHLLVRRLRRDEAASHTDMQKVGPLWTGITTARRGARCGGAAMEGRKGPTGLHDRGIGEIVENRIQRGFTGSMVRRG